MNSYMQKRIWMAVFGILLCGISVGMFNVSMMGTDPFSCFTLGIWNITGMNYSIMYTEINLLLFALIFIVNRRCIGISTFLNVFGLGFIIESSMKVLNLFFVNIGIPQRILLLFAAVVLMCLASSFYYTADLGVSAYDAIALTISERQRAIPFQFCRMGTDLVCTVIGFALGGTVGAGTVITALFMGPLLEFFKVKVAVPMLNRG